MKSLVCTIPGHFEYHQKEKPVLKPGHAIIKVKRIGICGTDLHAFEGTQPFFEYPRILGHELSGELIEFDDAPGFEKDEAVTYIPYFNCGQCQACRSGKPNCCSNIKVSGVHQDGGMVEFLSIPSGTLLHGEGLGLDDLALVEPLAVGAHAICRAGIRKEEFVLVIGAGPIGLATMEFAKLAGGKVIALDINESRLAFCRSYMNIFATINAGSSDVAGQIREITNGDMPTAVFDASGSLRAINNAFSFIAHGGRYILVGLQKSEISFSHPEFHKREATLMSSRNATRKDFEYAISSIQRGWITPAIYITHRAHFDQVKNQFKSWLDPATGVIKTMVDFD
jgi:2-desacetyl-2-hydroxyethyl bacteriochlorophyllide A dehydrogenase